MVAVTGATSVRLREVMSAEPIAVAPTDTLKQAAQILANNEISGAPVVDENGMVKGVISRTDILDWLLSGRQSPATDELLQAFATVPNDVREDADADELGLVRDVMSTQVLTALPDDLLADAARRMAEHRVHRVVVVNTDGRMAGIVTSFDVLKHFPLPVHPELNSAADARTSPPRTTT